MYHQLARLLGQTWPEGMRTGSWAQGVGLPTALTVSQALCLAIWQVFWQYLFELLQLLHTVTVPPRPRHSPPTFEPLLPLGNLISSALPSSASLTLDTFLPNGVARVAWISIKLNQNVAFFIKAISSTHTHTHTQCRIPRGSLVG